MPLGLNYSALLVLLSSLLLANNSFAEDSQEPDDEFESQFEQYDDPYESFNRVMYDINKFGDDYFLRPVAKGYRYVTPDFVDRGVTNFFGNLDDVETFANSLLQGKFHNAIVTLNRVIYNSTFGIGGLFDVATFFGLENDSEDFGQTLAVWGWENSDYLVLPLIGPTTFRDIGGRAVDTTFFDPLDFDDDVPDTAGRIALTALKIVDIRADLLSADGFLSGGDPYVNLRNAFLQNREFLIKDGEIEDSFTDEEFEDLDGF